MTGWVEKANPGDPGPREDPPEEPSHNAARIRDRERGVVLGDFIPGEEDSNDFNPKVDAKS